MSTSTTSAIVLSRFLVSPSPSPPSLVAVTATKLLLLPLVDQWSGRWWRVGGFAWSCAMTVGAVPVEVDQLSNLWLHKWSCFVLGFLFLPIFPLDKRCANSFHCSVHRELYLVSQVRNDDKFEWYELMYPGSLEIADGSQLEKCALEF